MPLWLQIILAVALCSVIAAFLLGRFVRDAETQYLESQLLEQSRELTALMAATSVEAVVREDALGLETVVEESGRVLRDLSRLSVHNRDGTELATWIRSDAAGATDVFVSRTPIAISTETFGSTVATWNMAPQRARIARHAQRLQVATFFGMLGTGALIAVLTHLLTSRPVIQIDRGLSELTQGRMAKPLRVTAAPELRRLANSVNALGNALQERDAREAELRASEQALARINEELRLEAGERARAEQEVRGRNQDLLRSNRALEEFAYAASHDLQEPLRKIQAFSSRLVSDYQDRLDDRGRDYLDRAHSAASRARRLIDDLLALARVSRAGAAFEAVDLNEIVDEARTELGERMVAEDATLHVSDLPTIAGVPSQLVQLFINLVENAIKFRHSDRAPHIRISAEAYQEGGNNGWTIRVKDNGIGFEPKYAAQIFSMFGRLHGRDKYEGTGIGLTICERIVHSHGGEIFADSEQGEGATFVMHVPALQGDGSTGPAFRFGEQSTRERRLESTS